MALSIRPADALIHRLLQQNSKVADVRETPGKTKVPTDHVNISAQAKSAEQGSDLKQSYGPVGYSSQHKQADLEARLLRMYSNSSDMENKKS
jgi:hypothetical protein